MAASDGYCDYELQLTWTDAAGVFVNGVSTGKYTGLPLDQLSPSDTFDNIRQQVGRVVTNLLFPQPEDIDRFKGKWRECQRIRLRLVYPSDTAQQKNLLAIPWEYLYLPLNPTAPEDRSNWLAMNDNVSIAHTLPGIHALGNDDTPSRKIKIDYVSWLGVTQVDKQNENKIFSRFETEIQNLKAITDLTTFGTNIGVSTDGSLPFPADRASLDNALRSTNLLHITSHGAADSAGGKLELEQLDVLTPEETFITSEKIKAILLLSCQSGGGTNSFAWRLHLKGIPVVIGMSQVIQFDPAEDFVAGFYNALSRNLTLGLEFATVIGRQKMYEKTQGDWYVGFGFPRLFLNGSDSAIMRKSNLYPDDQTAKSLMAYRDSLFQGNAIQAQQIEILPENLAALINWITNRVPQRLWYLMSGEQDEVRGAYIARILKELEGQGHKLIYHFCLDQPLATDDPTIFIDTKDRLAFVLDSLVPQLVSYFGEEKYYSWFPTDQYPLLTYNAKDALYNFVYTPLEAARKADPNYDQTMPVIIIDGINLIPPGHSRNNSILGLLREYQDILDNVARFLITADTLDIEDSDPEIAALIQDIRDLTLHYRDEPPDLNIDSSPEPDSFLNQLVEEEFKPPQITDLKEDQLWPALFKPAIEAAKDSYEALGGPPVLVNRILDAITLAYEPLFVDDIASVLGLQADSAEMLNLRRIVEQFCKPYAMQNYRLTLYHPRLKKYILRDMDLWHRRTTALTHELFVNAFRPTDDQAGSAKWSGMADWSKLSQTNWDKLAKSNDASSKVLIPRYVRRYLVHHAYESYMSTTYRDRQARGRRAETYLNLVCHPGYRIVRLAEVGLEAAVQDLWNGLRVIYTEYIHQPEATTEHAEQARLALDRMLAANEPNSYRHRRLLELEEIFRNGRTEENVSLLKDFLGLLQS